MTYSPIDLVENYFGRYVVYPDEHARTAHALWVPHTYMMSLWDITPRMGFFSPEPGSGKSRAIEVSRRLAHNPMPTASISGAAFMRMVMKETTRSSLMSLRVSTPTPRHAMLTACLPRS